MHSGGWNYWYDQVYDIVVYYRTAENYNIKNREPSYTYIWQNKNVKAKNLVNDNNFLYNKFYFKNILPNKSLRVLEGFHNRPMFTLTNH